ncbi:MAG: acyl-CoA desaturase [Planctomycetaceae bacterium]
MSTIPITPSSPASTVGREMALKFGENEGFLNALRKRVDDYFATSGKSRRDCWQMYVKTAIIAAWTLGSWALLVFVATNWWQALLSSVSLGFAMSAVGFNIQHDGGHLAYSRHRWVNRLMAMSLDLLGGSSFFWRKTHNIVHHTFTNVTGYDGDIDLGVLGRLSPHQPRYFFHRLQHLYLWFLYGFISFKWQYYDDFSGLITGRIGITRVERPRGADLAIFIFGKLFFLTMALVIPLMLHPPLTVLAFYFLTFFIQGVVLSTIFQLAHCVEEAEFPAAIGDPARIENEWAIHQVETTVDFAQNNPFICWYAGGLNFQIEHHLFPQICHLHYPALAPLVEQTCREFNVKYRHHPSVLSAVRSHYSLLRHLGKAESCQTPATESSATPAEVA